MALSECKFDLSPSCLQMLESWRVDKPWINSSDLDTVSSLSPLHWSSPIGCFVDGYLKARTQYRMRKLIHVLHCGADEGETGDGACMAGR